LSFLAVRLAHWGGDPSQRRRRGSAARDKPVKPVKKPRSRMRRILKWTGIATVLTLIAGVAAFFIAYAAIDLPDPNEEFETQTTRVYYSDGKTLLGEFRIQDRRLMALADVPEHVIQAVIAAEDRSFYSNNGLDLKGIIRAAWNNASTDSTQGASTITQQYVKVLYLTQERTLTRKIKEAFLSLKLQRQLSKDEILQGYLNTIYFGRGAYGLQTAANAYFEKDAEELSISEGAALAAILNSPGNYDPANGPEAREALKARYAFVLDGMAEAGDIDAAEAEELAEKLPKFPKIKATDTYGGPEGFLLNMVERELRAQGMTESDIYGGGWTSSRRSTSTCRPRRPARCARRSPTGSSSCTSRSPPSSPAPARSGALRRSRLRRQLVQLGDRRRPARLLVQAVRAGSCAA
jgi:membrane peptidoglycan carboxypeptidase